eukprot:m51a1_g14132 putative eukaryotic translation initiation factor 3 subunit i-like (325) ;mRNA; f:223806-224976
MKPLLLHAHTRAITHIEYNYDGDLIFTSAKDQTPMAWRTDNGERLGTYEGHKGAVWYLSVNRLTTRLLTGSADQTARIWDIESGKELRCFQHDTPVRCVQWATGDKLFLTVTDAVRGYEPHVFVYRYAEDESQQLHKPVLDIRGFAQGVKVTHAAWAPLNEALVVSSEDGVVRVYDAETGQKRREMHEHDKSVVQIAYDRHGLLFATASKDGKAKLFDARSYELLKTYDTHHPVNSAALSPLRDHVLTGGGQDSNVVTTTRVDNSQFAAVLWDLVHQEEIGRVPGHFGPIHSLAFAPDGRGFASGSEDGYIRLHRFDDAYFSSM